MTLGKLQNCVTVMEVAEDNSSYCDCCELNKRKRRTDPKSSATRVSNAPDMVHSEPISPLLTNGSKHAIRCVDSHNSIIHVHLLRSGVGIFSTILRGEIKRWCRSKSIEQEPSVVDKPEENWKVKRVCRSNCVKTKCMIDQRVRGCKMYWPCAFNNSAYIKTMCVHSALGKQLF